LQMRIVLGFAASGILTTLLMWQKAQINVQWKGAVWLHDSSRPWHTEVLWVYQRYIDCSYPPLGWLGKISYKPVRSSEDLNKINFVVTDGCTNGTLKLTTNLVSNNRMTSINLLSLLSQKMEIRYT
jgi:hypothetical protein